MTRSRSPSVTALRANAGPEAPSGCRRGSHRIRWMSPVASATTREISDEADKKEAVFHFCPDCGSQVFYTEPTEPDLIVVSVGSFADPSFPPPTPEVGHRPSPREGRFRLRSNPRRAPVPGTGRSNETSERFG